MYSYFKNCAEEFYPHESLSTPIKVLSYLSLSIQCYISILMSIKFYATLIEIGLNSGAVAAPKRL
jgi:hypothetical protein